MSGSSTEPGEWYFDLDKGRAVPAAERGHADHMLGPYPSRSAAENWRSQIESRNEAWDAEDERWERSGEQPEQ
jgi:hypothetical protein